MIEPTILVGPPGTGKTTTLLDTVNIEMERGIPPDRIGFMTFTKRGVEEAIGRASVRFNLQRNKFRYFNTLHSAAFRHLGLSSDQVFTGKKIREFGQEIGLELYNGISSDDGTYGSFYGDDAILFLENLARITRTPLEAVLNDYDFMVPDTERAARVIKQIREHKLKEGLYDFTDMIEEFIRQDDAPMLDVLIVDEAQDLSELQWLMVTLLSRHVKRMYVAGDDDQTIFTWAGASERFISMPGKVETLKQSFRVPVSVQMLALRIIEQINSRRHKIWKARDAEGSVSIIEDVSRLNPLVRGDRNTMLLGRTVKMIRSKFVPYCRTNGLPFRYFEYSSIKQTHAEAITAWNDLQEGSAVPANIVTRIYDLLPSEGHKQKKGLVKRGYKAQLNRIAEQEDPPMLRLQELKNDYGLLAEGSWNEVFTEIDAQDVTYIQKVLDNGFDITANPKIHISTIHRVKGSQADLVVLLSDTAKAADKYLTENQDEETRVLYTGITRTFEDLVIVQPYTRYHYGRLFD
jgi:superfamily I DNA/RNA helicase